MSGIQPVSDNGNPVSVEALQGFANTFSGAIIRPGDDGYDRARRVWNGSIDKRPGVIAHCSGVADVVAAVNFARDEGLLAAVRGGGHNVGGRAVCDDGIVIDLSSMQGVFVDPANRSVRVQGGATLGVLDRETHVFGLAVPAGVVSGTGIAGLTLGGGVGWLTRKYGMTIDNLLACQVVTADGSVLTASPGSHHDLFWALRGGGGNFGVVTSFEFRAWPVSTVLGGLLVHPRERAAELLRFYRDFVESAPEELTAYAGLLVTPDGTPVVAMIPCYCGDVEEGERLIQPLRDFGSAIVDTVQPIPFPAMQSLLDASYPKGNHHYWKSALLREFPDEAIDLIVEHAGRMTSPISSIVIGLEGGAASRVGASETAFRYREAPWDIGIFAQWTEPSGSAAHLAWARELAAGLAPFASGGHLISFLDRDEDEAVRSSFGANYGRLAAIKKTYDPANFFRVNQNIRPA